MSGAGRSEGATARRARYPDLVPGRTEPPAEKRLAPWRLVRALMLVLLFILVGAHLAFVVLWFVIYPLAELCGVPAEVQGVVGGTLAIAIALGGPVWMAFQDPTYFFGAPRAPTRLRPRKTAQPDAAE